MDGNWIKVNRQILDSNVFEDAKTFKVFMWILLNANYKKRTLLNGMTLNAGQLCTSRERIATACNMHPSSVSRVLTRLIRCKTIVKKANSRGTVIDVINWGLYQHAEATGEQQTNSYRTASEQLANTEEEGKKGRRKENYNISAQTDGLHTVNGSKKVTQYSAEFDRFWDAWPKGGRKTNKRRAFREFKRAKKLVDVSVLMDAVAAYAASPKGRGEFCQMPSSWLSGGCWDDDRASWNVGKPLPPSKPKKTQQQINAAVMMRELVGQLNDLRSEGRGMSDEAERIKQHMQSIEKITG